MKSIIPFQIIINFSEDRDVLTSILKYKIEEDGKLGDKFETMSWHAALDPSKLQKSVDEAIKADKDLVNRKHIQTNVKGN